MAHLRWHTSAVLYCHLWPAPLYDIFPHYLINGTTLEKKVTEHKMCVLIFCAAFFLKHFSFYEEFCQTMSKTFICVYLTLILLTWKIWWGSNNARKWQMGFNSAFKGLNCSFNFSRKILEKILKYQISWKSVQSESRFSMQSEGQTGRHDNANTCLLSIFQTPPQISSKMWPVHKAVTYRRTVRYEPTLGMSPERSHLPASQHSVSDMHSSNPVRQNILTFDSQETARHSRCG